MDKYSIEAWISILSQLHCCIGLQREKETHPICNRVLYLLTQEMEKTIACYLCGYTGYPGNVQPSLKDDILRCSQCSEEGK
jgi:hypothetical protein